MPVVSTGPQRALPPGIDTGDVPGFEFEGRRTRRERGVLGFAGRTPGAARTPRQQTSRQQTSREQTSRQRTSREGAAPRERTYRDRSSRSAGWRAPARPGPVPAGREARAEWTKLLRSFLPQPEKRDLAKEFVANLNFRGLVTRVVLPIFTMISVGIAVVVGLDLHSGTGSSPPVTSLGFPPATLAGGDFAASTTEVARGVSQSIGRVASDGATVVAVGSETGLRIPRAQFFISQDSGVTWSMATVAGPDGGAPPPGHAARLIAGGQGEWAAIGADSIWTSATGKTWTLVSATGLPIRAGDQVNVLRRTSAGFIATGVNVKDGNSTPIIFLSADGVSWQRLSAANLTVPGGGQLENITYVTASGNQVLMAGDVLANKTVTTGKKKHDAVVQAGQAWLSNDGGRTWTPLTVPQTHGAQDQFAGAATAGNGFLLVRPATTAAGLPAADVFWSPNATTWTFAATLTVPAGTETIGTVNGGAEGAVVTATVSDPATNTSTNISFVSADGVTWHRSAEFGKSEQVSGATTMPGGAVVTGVKAGQPLITVVTQAGARNVPMTAIPGALQPQLAVNAVAAQGASQVAVGSANGYPAVWLSADGGSMWTRASGQTPAVLERPGVQQLNAVTDGSTGWVAVGDVISGAPQHPVVVVSADGSNWAQADTEAAFSGQGLFTQQVAAGRNGYVIVGYQQAAPGQTAIAAAWFSTGLTGWRRASDAAPGALDGGAGSNLEMLGVTATAGQFVAVGLHGNHPAAWTAPDGLTWSRTDLPVPAGAARAVLLNVAASGTAIAATGTAQTAAGTLFPFAARSADGGKTWTESALPVPSGIARVSALTVAGATFTATGTFGASPGHQDVVVWTSEDGLSWKAATPAGEGLAGPGIQDITGLAASGNTLTGVGFTASAASEEPVFWQSPIR